MAGETGVPVVIMHNRQVIDANIDIMADLVSFFSRSIDLALKAGVPDGHIILDPGVGFGKTFDQHVEVIARLDELKRQLPYPVLVGTSRKSLLGVLLERKGPKDRLFGTLASNVVAASLGADIIRVHDIAANVDAVRVTDAILRKRR